MLFHIVPPPVVLHVDRVGVGQGGHMCSCPAEHTLAADGRTCNKDKKMLCPALKRPNHGFFRYRISIKYLLLQLEIFEGLLCTCFNIQIIAKKVLH